MEVEQNFVDSHGVSFVGFGITRLLDFDLIARFKQINTMKLYVPGRGGQYVYPGLAPGPPGGTGESRWAGFAAQETLAAKDAGRCRPRPMSGPRWRGAATRRARRTRTAAPATRR